MADSPRSMKRVVAKKAHAIAKVDDKACMNDRIVDLIALQLTPYLGEKTLARLMEGDETLLQECFSAAEEDLRERYRFHSTAARYFSRHRSKLQEDARLLLASLHRAGADAVALKDPRYPERLRKLPDAPPILYSSGDAELIGESSVCFLASSRTTDASLIRLRALSDRIAQEGYPIVTGHNRNTYQAAALSAVQFASPVIYVLDCGLYAAGDGEDQPFPAARIGPDPDQRKLFLSPFRPKDPWIGHNNQRRDRLISALAQILVAVDVRPGGVMERECRAALERGQRVIALAPEGRIPEAHDRLFDHGALLIQHAEEIIRHLWDAGIQPP
jgi:DNA processing protein